METIKSAIPTAEVSNSKLREIFIDQLQIMYWAEQKLVRTLAKMEDAAHEHQLKQAFNSHLQETKNHVSRLVKIFNLIGVPASAKKCFAMAGITDEGEEIIVATEERTAQRDLGLILAGQKAEHYEIATYGGLVQLARTLGLTDAAEIMGVTLAEEKKTDTLLTRIATDALNR